MEYIYVVFLETARPTLSEESTHTTPESGLGIHSVFEQVRTKLNLYWPDILIYNKLTLIFAHNTLMIEEYILHDEDIAPKWDSRHVTGILRDYISG